MFFGYEEYDNYEDYEKACSVIKEKNKEYIALFEVDLMNSGLTAKTIENHLNNVDFYINTFLLRSGPHEMESGTILLDLFLGDFFIRKCMWSTPGTIKTTAASIKKFYKCMLNYGKIQKSSYDELCSEIKENLTTWQLDCAIFNDPDAPNPFYCPF